VDAIALNRKVSIGKAVDQWEGNGGGCHFHSSSGYQLQTEWNSFEGITLVLLVGGT